MASPSRHRQRQASAVTMVALGLCVASMNVMCGSRYGVLSSIAAFCLTGVQLVAAALYFWKAWSPDCVQFYDNHGQEIIKQALLLLACQALLYALLFNLKYAAVMSEYFSIIPTMISGHEALNRMLVHIPLTCLMLFNIFFKAAILAGWLCQCVDSQSVQSWYFYIAMAVLGILQA